MTSFLVLKHILGFVIISGGVGMILRYIIKPFV